MQITNVTDCYPGAAQNFDTIIRPEPVVEEVKEKELSVGAIVGISIGVTLAVVLLVVLVCAGCIYYCVKRKRRSESLSQVKEEELIIENSNEQRQLLHDLES